MTKHPYAGVAHLDEAELDTALAALDDAAKFWREQGGEAALERAARYTALARTLRLEAG